MALNPDPPAPSDELRIPFDPEAERAVLGAIMLDPRAVDAATEVLRPEDFYRPAHQVIFSAMVELSGRSEAIDPITVRSELERGGTLEKAGGAAYLGSLLDGLPRITNVGQYARLVKDRALLRHVLSISEELRSGASEGKTSAVELIDRAEGSLFQLSEAGRRGGFQPITEIAREGLETLEELLERRELVTGVSTGFKKLDWMTSGFQRGDMVVLAARPSMGKTALALNIAQHAATRGELSVGIFSLEMSAEQLFFRMISSEAMVPAHKLRTGRVSSEEWDRVTHAFETLTRARIFVDDTPGVTPMEIRSKARRLKREHDAGLIVVDYLQLMSMGGSYNSRQQEISDISRSLKAIAKELSVPVVALSQLSRAPDQRQGDHRPQLSDLRESGAIEQDADVVMFIYRPEVYEKDPDKIAEKELEGIAEVIVAKQRNGPVGFVPLFFVKEYALFQNRDDDGF
jgi:replicative DNA helicase